MKDELFSLGDVVLVVPNDEAVAAHWVRVVGIPKPFNVLADPECHLVEALGMKTYIKGLGFRSRRFAVLIEHGEVLKCVPVASPATLVATFTAAVGSRCVSKDSVFSDHCDDTPTPRAMVEGFEDLSPFSASRPGFTDEVLETPKTTSPASSETPSVHSQFSPRPWNSCSDCPDCSASSPSKDAEARAMAKNTVKQVLYRVMSSLEQGVMHTKDEGSSETPAGPGAETKATVGDMSLASDLPTTWVPSKMCSSSSSSSSSSYAPSPMGSLASENSLLQELVELSDTPVVPRLTREVSNLFRSTVSTELLRSSSIVPNHSHDESSHGPGLLFDDSSHGPPKMLPLRELDAVEEGASQELTRDVSEEVLSEILSEDDAFKTPPPETSREQRRLPTIRLIPTRVRGSSSNLNRSYSSGAPQETITAEVSQDVLPLQSLQTSLPPAESSGIPDSLPEEYSDVPLSSNRSSVDLPTVSGVELESVDIPFAEEEKAIIEPMSATYLENELLDVEVKSAMDNEKDLNNKVLEVEKDLEDEVLDVEVKSAMDNDKDLDNEVLDVEKDLKDEVLDVEVKSAMDNEKDLDNEVLDVEKDLENEHLDVEVRSAMDNEKDEVLDVEKDLQDEILDVEVKSAMDREKGLDNEVLDVEKDLEDEILDVEVKSAMDREKGLDNEVLDVEKDLEDEILDVEVKSAMDNEKDLENEVLEVEVNQKKTILESEQSDHSPTSSVPSERDLSLDGYSKPKKRNWFKKAFRV
ncbi:MAG: uncharacterized protein KVP18_003964 [Porospora cf. gigantea A]|nr:MAG: hypothetical protein KVP18_003964 [Porospora cf. gigantea A]